MNTRMRWPMMAITQKGALFAAPLTFSSVVRESRRISLNVWVVRFGPSVMDASDVVSRVCHGQAKGWAAKLEYISFHDVNDRRDSLCFGQSRWRHKRQTQG